MPVTLAVFGTRRTSGNERIEIKGTDHVHRGDPVINGAGRRQGRGCDGRRAEVAHLLSHADSFAMGACRRANPRPGHVRRPAVGGRPAASSSLVDADAKVREGERCTRRVRRQPPALARYREDLDRRPSARRPADGHLESASTSSPWRTCCSSTSSRLATQAVTWARADHLLERRDLAAAPPAAGTPVTAFSITALRVPPTSRRCSWRRPPAIAAYSSAPALARLGPPPTSRLRQRSLALARVDRRRYGGRRIRESCAIRRGLPPPSASTPRRRPPRSGLGCCHIVPVGVSAPVSPPGETLMTIVLNTLIAHAVYAIMTALATCSSPADAVARAYTTAGSSPICRV